MTDIQVEAITERKLSKPGGEVVVQVSVDGRAPWYAVAAWDLEDPEPQAVYDEMMAAFRSALGRALGLPGFSNA